MPALDRESVRVLMVECEAGERKAASEALEMAGFEVLTWNGVWAELNAELWQMQRPDVVVVGELKDALERKVGEAKGWPAAVVHVVDGGEVERISMVLAEDAGECVVKPFGRDQLVVTVQTSLTRRALRERARAQMEQEQTRAQVELQEKAVDAAAWDALPQAVVVADMLGRVVTVNQTAAQWLGNSAKDLIGRLLNEVCRVTESIADGENEKDWLALGGQGDGDEGEVLKFQAGDGEPFLVEGSRSILRDQCGGMQGVVLVFSHAQPQLVAEDGKLGTRQELAASVTDPLLAVDGEWQICFANGAAMRCLGNGREPLEGKSWWGLLPTAVMELHGEVFELALQRGEMHTAEVFVESSGAWHEVRSYPYPPSGGRLLWLKDITTRKLEWERGNRLDRLESLGLLARGFAHDFNNLLTVLLGNLAMAEQRMTAKAEAPEAELRAARQATLLAQGLVQQLLTFARGGAPVKRGVSLQELVKHFFEQHPRVASIDYTLQIGEGLPAVRLDPNQIRRLLGNLVRNAEQAMAQGGKLVLRCEAVDSASLFGHDVLKDDPEVPAGVVLEVEDGGEGIAAKHLPHVFEPYFTTRKKNNATGLGLTVCESIARAHGGTINIYGVKPNGTRVRFFLPVEEEDGTEGGEGAASGAGASQGVGAAREGKVETAEAEHSKARILVLEDDHLVRTLISKGLKAQGFEVTETADGLDTVRLYEESLKERRPFDVVILDLSIPNGMGGVRTMEKLRGLDPQVLALVSSGYSDDPAMAQPSLYGFAAVLPKPYEPMELIQMVKRLLEEKMKSGK